MNLMLLIIKQIVTHLLNCSRLYYLNYLIIDLKGISINLIFDLIYLPQQRTIGFVFVAIFKSKKGVQLMILFLIRQELFLLNDVSFTH